MNRKLYNSILIAYPAISILCLHSEHSYKTIPICLYVIFCIQKLFIRKKDSWISVKDELPIEKEEVFIDEIDTMHMGERIGDKWLFKTGLSTYISSFDKWKRK